MAPQAASQHVVQMQEEGDGIAHTWAKELELILRDRDAAFKRVRVLRSLLQNEISWDRSLESLLHEFEHPTGE